METINAPEHELYIQAAAMLAQRIIENGKARSPCVLGIVGGRSVPKLFDHLLPYALQFKQEGVHIEVFWLDERIDGEKNFASVLHVFEKMQGVGIDIAWHPFMSLSVQAAEVEIRQVYDHLASLQELPRFDLVILSAGEDGHIASLFPHRPALSAEHLGYMIEEQAPKPPAQRVTTTPALLRSTKEAFLFFIGKKRLAYALFTDPKTPIEDCPAKLLLRAPKLTVFTALQ